MDCCNIKVAIKARPLNLKEQLDNKVFWKVESDSVVHFDPITEKKNGEQFFFGKHPTRELNDFRFYVVVS